MRGIRRTGRRVSAIKMRLFVLLRVVGLGRSGIRRGVSVRTHLISAKESDAPPVPTATKRRKSANSATNPPAKNNVSLPKR
jgi:hypothetical protein